MAIEQIKVLKEIYERTEIDTPQLVKLTGKKANNVSSLGNLLEGRKLVIRRKTYEKRRNSFCPVPVIYWRIRPSQRERALRLIKQVFEDFNEPQNTTNQNPSGNAEAESTLSEHESPQVQSETVL